MHIPIEMSSEPSLYDHPFWRYQIWQIQPFQEMGVAKNSHSPNNSLVSIFLMFLYMARITCEKKPHCSFDFKVPSYVYVNALDNYIAVIISGSHYQHERKYINTKLLKATKSHK